MSGVVYVAYGPRAVKEAGESIASLRRHNSLPVVVVGDVPVRSVRGLVPFRRPGPGARWAKLNVDRLVPWDAALYLDADTRVNGDVSAGFRMLASGWDMLAAPSVNQGGDLFRHVALAERETTLVELGNPFPLQLQAGVLFFDRRRCARLFALWRDEWLRFRDKDQAALLRALDRSPCRVGLLGREWNGGGLIEHRFGRAR